MNFVLFFWEYIAWHYGRSIPEFLEVWKNLLWFLYHFFSIPLLLRTLFQPFHRLEIHQRRVSMEEHAANFVANTLMRILGFILRVFIICVALIVICGALVFGSTFFILWILLPVTFLGFLVSSIYFMIVG